MLDLIPPPSDVTSRDLPYRLGVVLAGPAGGRSVEVRLQRGDGDEPLTARLPLPEGSTRWELRIDAAALAPGEYAGEVTVGESSRAFSFFRQPDGGPPAMPLGIYAFPVPPDTAGQDALLAELRACGIDTITEHMSEFGPHRAFCDRAARHDLHFQPSVRYWRDGQRDRWQKTAAAVTNGEPANPRWLCLNQPDLRAEAAANVEQFLGEYAAHPAFAGAVWFGDDLFLPARFAEGTASIGCYCARCRADYQAAVGAEPPLTATPRRGTVPADHEWLTWNRFRCDHEYAGFIRAMAAARDRVDPRLAMGLCHGWPDNPFNAVGTGLYGPLTQVTGVVSSYCYPFLRSPSADFIVHYELGRMGHRREAVWMLGFMEGDNTMAPGWHVQQGYWNMLAAGYRSIAFFSWWNLPRLRREGSPEVRRRVEEAVAALTRCGEHKRWIFPVAARWRRPAARFAQLFSLTTECFDLAPPYQAQRHLRAVAGFYRRVLAAHVPLELIAEEEILHGCLDQYDVVCLHDVRALRDDVAAALADYVEAGGAVYVDRDLYYHDGWHPQAKVTIAGALELAPEAMIHLLERHAGRRLRCDQPDTTIRSFTAGAVDYVVAVNNYPDRVTGMPYSYGDPDANYRHADLVDSLPVEAELRFPEDGRWLFDAATGEALGETGEPLRLSLEPAWGRVLAVLPAGGARLTVELPASVVAGEAVSCRIRALDAAGRELPGDFAASVALVSPSGEVRERFHCLAGGRLETTLHLGINDRPGSWTVRVAGGFPRRTVHAALAVLPPSPATWLEVSTC